MCNARLVMSPSACWWGTPWRCTQDPRASLVFLSDLRSVARSRTGSRLRSSPHVVCSCTPARMSTHQSVAPALPIAVTSPGSGHLGAHMPGLVSIHVATHSSCSHVKTHVYAQMPSAASEGVGKFVLKVRRRALLDSRSKKESTMSGSRE